MRQSDKVLQLLELLLQVLLQQYHVASIPAALDANRSALRAAERVSDIRRNRPLIETGSH